MERNVTECAERMRKFLSDEALEEIGREVEFFKRRRKFTAARAVWTFVTGLGAGAVNSLADFVSLFADLTGETIEYKPFHDRISNPGFAELMRATFASLLGNLTPPILRGRSRYLRKFEDIVIQDGSSYALNPALADVYAGRFTKVSPAAVEVHCTYSLYQGQTLDIGISADKDSERTYLPEPASLRKKLILFDRGYTSYDYGRQVKEAGGDFIGRARDKKFNPKILKCYRGFADKKRIVGKRLSDIKLPKCNVDLLIEGFDQSGKRHEVRLALFYVKRKDVHLYLLTSLSPAEVPPSVVASLYRLRWQVELFFKECKSYTKLKRFQTKDPCIVDGLIWGSMLAVLIRRFLLYAAFQRTKKRVAPFIAASMSWTFFRSLGRAAVHRFAGIREVLLSTLDFLRRTAERTNPHRGDTFTLLEIMPLSTRG